MKKPNFGVTAAYLLLSLSINAQDRGIPAEIRDSSGRQLWVAANASESDVKCDEVIGGTYDEHPITSLTELSAKSLAIYRGNVAEIAPGFFRGQPGSLLRITIREVVRASPRFENAPDLYLFIEHARFEARGKTFCCGLWPIPIARGNEIVLFATAPPVDGTDSLLTEATTPYFVAVKEDGKLSFVSRARLRANLNANRITTLSGLIERVSLHASVLDNLRK